jgi:hypothetical protein
MRPSSQASVPSRLLQIGQAAHLLLVLPAKAAAAQDDDQGITPWISESLRCLPVWSGSS